jgi:hypothetical protein
MRCNTYNIVCDVVCDVVRKTYDVVRDTYDVVYDVTKTYDVVFKNTVLAILTYDVVYDVTYDVVRKTYDIVRKTYDVVYDVAKTYDVAFKKTVLAIFTYDVVYDIVGFRTMSYVTSYVYVAIIRCRIRYHTQHRHYTMSRSIYDLTVRRRITCDMTYDMACLTLRERAPCLTSHAS